MKWNEEEGYVIYKTSITNLKSLLGISDINFSKRCELAPYITYIVKYINSKLVLLGTNDIKTLIQEVFDIQEYGSEKIINGEIIDLLLLLGISNEDIYDEVGEIPYNQDRFVFSWADFMSSLITRLKLQYSRLLNDPINTECPCDICSPGQTVEDYENWTSGVYPEDESHIYYNYESSDTGWRVRNDDLICNKCQRKSYE